MLLLGNLVPVISVMPSGPNRMSRAKSAMACLTALQITAPNSSEAPLL